MEPFSTYKQYVALLLLIALILQSFSRIVIVGDYYINTDRYAAFCENKAKPEKHCNGQCQMVKRIQQEDEKENKSPFVKIEGHSGFYYFEQQFLEIKPFIMVSEKQTFAAMIEPETSDRANPVFKPPIA